MNLSQGFINLTSFIGSIATFLSLWLAIYWNWQSNRNAKKREAETYRNFVKLLNSIRQIELERISKQRKQIKRECDILEGRHNLFVLRSDTTPDEKDEESREYLLRAGQLAVEAKELDASKLQFYCELAMGVSLGNIFSLH